MTDITYSPIGTIHSPFREPKGMPIQPSGAKGVEGTAEVVDEYAPGLQDLEGFSHIILIYHMHLASGWSLKVKPFLDPEKHGVFATRAPARPNPIGLSIVRLVRIEGATLHIEGVDVVDGTPLLDVKPYVPAFDGPRVERIGWLEDRVKNAADTRSDDRFTGS